MERKYEHEAFQVIHEDMMDLHRSGIISDARMKEFDEMCLVEEPNTPKEAENSPKKVKRIKNEKVKMNK